MALVNCPECGREKVSDTASACPDCGFDIKNYYENKRKVEAQKKHKKEAEIQKQKELQEFKDNIKAPEEPTRSTFYTVLISIFFILATIGFVTACADPDELVIGVLVGGFFSWLGIRAVMESKDDLDKRRADYELAKTNFEKYQEEMLKREKERQEDMELDRQRQIRECNNKPRCPNCSSTNIRRISNINRAVSVATVGVASSKIGKQYECLNCKHKW